MKNSPPVRILLTILGTKLHNFTYCLEDRQVQASSAAAALCKLLPAEKQPAKILALCTDTALATTFAQLAVETNVECQAIEIPESSEPADLEHVLQKLMTSVPEHAELMLDVSHGFRHYSLLSYIAALHIGAIKFTRLSETFCAQFSDTTAKIYSLTPVVLLPEWLYHIRAFKERGQAGGLSQQVLGLTGIRGSLKSLSRHLSDFHSAYEAAVPLELFRSAFKLSQALPKAAPDLARLLTGGDELIKQIAAVAEGFAIHSIIAMKELVPLTEEIVTTQARLVDTYLEREDFNSAFGLMSEWMVTRILLGRRAEKWLDYQDVRRPAESELHALVERQGKGTLEPEYDDIATFWHQLKLLRNLLHHHGMRNDRFDPRGAGVEKVRQLWRKRASWAHLLTFPPRPSRGKVLIGGLAGKPGPLYSALKLTQPEYVVVICSEESQSKIALVREAADFHGEIEQRVLADKFSGHKELDLSAIAQSLIGATEVNVNATGGTTVMRLIAAKLGAEASRIGIPVRTFGLIDRREKPAQEADPFVEGEIFWVD